MVLLDSFVVVVGCLIFGTLLLSNLNRLMQSTTVDIKHLNIIITNDIRLATVVESRDYW